MAISSFPKIGSGFWGIIGRLQVGTYGYIEGKRAVLYV